MWPIAVRPLSARAVWLAKSCGSSSARQSSIGIDTNAGPIGGSVAWLIACASANGTSSARGGSKLDFTNGRGTSAASRLVSVAPIVISERACWPAVTSSGARLARALKIAPIALPRPGAVWRFTCATRPLACAYPSAMPTATISCKPST